MGTKMTKTVKYTKKHKITVFRNNKGEVVAIVIEPSIEWS